MRRLLMSLSASVHSQMNASFGARIPSVTHTYTQPNTPFLPEHTNRMRVEYGNSGQVNTPTPPGRTTTTLLHQEKRMKVENADADNG